MKRRNRFWAMIVLALSFGLFFACATDDGFSSEEGVPLALSRPETPGLNPRAIPAGEYVFTDSGEWTHFWEKYQQTPAPEIDFGEHTLVAVFLGQKPNSGYSVKIVGAKEYANETVVEVADYLPEPGMMYLQMITYPCDLALIPATQKQIRFERSEKIGRP